jgi:hypothetical protein
MLLPRYPQVFEETIQAAMLQTDEDEQQHQIEQDGNIAHG